MRRLRLVPSLLVVLLSACNEKLIEQIPSGSTQPGEVVINLSSDVSAAAVKSAGDEAVNVDDFWIEIFNSDKIRLYSGQYNSTQEFSVRLNAGKYRLLAKYGDTLGVGFDKPFYMADEQFSVRGQTRETVDAVASLANVKTTVVFGENIRRFYSKSDCYAVVRHTELKNKSLKFDFDQTGAGYIPGGELVLEVYAKIDGVWKYYAAPAATYSPRDFVTFTVDTGMREGTLALNIRIDDSVDVFEENIEIPSTALAALPPLIVPVSFDETDSYCVVEGQESFEDNVSLSFSAHSGIKSCVFSVSSGLLDVPASVDLCSIGQADAASLENAGFFWAMDNIDGVIDLSGILSVLGRNSVYTSREEATVAELSVELTDVNDRTAEKTVYIKVSPDASAKVIIPEYDVWARRIESPHLEVVKASKPSLISLQYSKDGSSWISSEAVSTEGALLGFNNLSGLEPATEYSIRAVYDGWCVISDVVTVRTEEAAQVGNAGFEEWTETVWYNTALYEPFGDSANQWWDVNSKVSMPDHKYLTYACFKCMPTVTYSNNNHHGGSASAQVSTINIGGGNSEWATTGDWHIGELFIGDADNNGKKVSTGHSFPSRPSVVRFWYQFSSYESSERFGVDVSLSAVDGTVIARASLSDGSATDNWTQINLPINYLVPDKTASSIYISFKSSTLNEHSCSAGGNFIEIAGETGSENKDRIKLATMLCIDDVELIYE